MLEWSNHIKVVLLTGLCGTFSSIGCRRARRCRRRPRAFARPEASEDALVKFDQLEVLGLQNQPLTLRVHRQVLIVFGERLAHDGDQHVENDDLSDKRRPEEINDAEQVLKPDCA